MNWVHYLNDPATTGWGRLRAQNGHPAPYNVRYFQIDNEPMNNGFTPESYAEIVNVYGSRLRTIVPNARIVACGQKRSSDMDWSEKVIDIAGDNFISWAATTMSTSLITSPQGSIVSAAT